MTVRIQYNRLLLAAAMALPFALAACGEDKARQMVGTLERDRIELKVESSEPITAIHVVDGQTVSAGDPVLEQDPARMQARLAQQQALRDQAAARLAELERGPREEAIREARAQLEAGQVRRENAEADFHRAKEIFDKGLSNQADLDRAGADWKAAAAQQKAMREALDTLLHGTTAEELQQAAAKVRAAEALVAQAGLDVERARIIAPVDGVIDKVLYQLGERPPPGSTVAVLLDTSRTFARIYVPEYLRAGIQQGDALTIHIDGTAREWRGTVRWVSSDASFTPYFALTEHDRSRLSYLAEVDLPEAGELPSGVPLVGLSPD
jgi:HlyD family secretion protein